MLHRKSRYRKLQQEVNVHRAKDQLETNAHRVTDQLEANVHRVTDQLEMNVHRVIDQLEVNVHRVTDQFVTNAQTQKETIKTIEIISVTPTEMIVVIEMENVLTVRWINSIRNLQRQLQMKYVEKKAVNVVMTVVIITDIRIMTN